MWMSWIRRTVKEIMERLKGYGEILRREVKSSL
jgi:hypothetical protein